jgi:hypothetical protein
VLPLDHFEGHAKVVEHRHEKIVARQFSVLVRKFSEGKAVDEFQAKRGIK